MHNGSYVSNVKLFSKFCMGVCKIVPICIGEILHWGMQNLWRYAKFDNGSEELHTNELGEH